jgi:hypothetical protein
LRNQGGGAAKVGVNRQKVGIKGASPSFNRYQGVEMNWFAKLIAAAVVAGLVTPQLRAQQNIFWLGGTGTLDSANYTNGTTTAAPISTDVVHFGAGGTGTYSSGTLSIGKLRVGTNTNSPAPASTGAGAGTVTISNGAVLDLSVADTGTGAANANLWVGNDQNGTLNIDGANTLVVTKRLAEIGYGADGSKSGNLNITNGGRLSVLNNNMNVGDRVSTGGVPGHVTVSGADSILSVSGSSADFNIGIRAGSSYSQSDGTVTIAGQVVVGQNAAQSSSFSMSGGKLTAGSSIIVGNNTAHGSSFNVSGGTLQSASVTIGNAANNVTGSFTGNAIINIPTNNFNVGLGTSQNASVLIADNVAIHIPNTASSTGNVFIGRDTSTGATFTMTGGTIDMGRNFLLGNATGATGIVGNQSGGTITTALNFVVTDTNGASTYNLSGTGAIVSNGLVIVGRQTATGVMNQTGGSVTAALGVAVANAQSATTSTWGTGIYNVSGGTITANQTTGTALAIAPQGNSGTFRVIGDDATIDVNGNMTVNAGGGAQGTLAYRLEAGDVLSLIDVSGNATFSSGAILNFDTSLASPTQATYNVLTAVDIIDSGITFNGPSGWSYHIISGGNGEILQFYQPTPPGLPGDFNNDGKVDAGDYVTWRKNDGTNNTLPNDNGLGSPIGAAHYNLWRANFGNPPGGGTGLNGAAVPEPATMMLCFCAVAALTLARRR